jgi:radial spoke head protein 3
MKQAADILRLERETAEKLAAKAFAKSYLSDLVPSVFNNLRENGYFYDPVQRDLETGFMPWIVQHALNELNQLNVGRLLLDSLLRNVVIKREEDYSNIEEKQRQLEQETDEENKLSSPQPNETEEPNEASNRDEVKRPF